MDTKKLLVITWILLAFLIGAGVGYLLGINGIGQRAQMPPFGGPASQQSGFDRPAGGPGGQGMDQSGNQPMMQPGGQVQQPQQPAQP